MTDAEIRAAYVAKCAAYAKEKNPGITTKQANAIGERTASRVTIWSEAILKNADQVGWLVDAEIGIDRSLVRPVPSASVAQRHLEAQWLADNEATHLPPTVRVEIAREIGAADGDALLAMVPADAARTAEAVKPSEVEKLDARQNGNVSTEAADDEFLKRMGEDPYQILPSRRRMLLAARDAQPQGIRQAALMADELTLKSGGDPDRLSAVDRLTLARASVSLK